MLQFTKATKRTAKLRLGLVGPAGSGKTYSALAIASGLGSRIAFIDTEHGSASKYSDLFSFDVIEFDSYKVENFIEGIQSAEAAGYDVLVIDSLSHAWAGKDGILEFVDKRTAASNSKNAYTSGWREATPLHNKLIDTILQAKLHIICCLRSKTEYVMEKNERTGKNEPRKIGMQPVQREGMEYEFDVLGDLDLDHNLIIGKTRCPHIDGEVYKKPGKEFADILHAWLSDGSDPDPAPKQKDPAPDPAKTETQGPAAETTATTPQETPAAVNDELAKARNELLNKVKLCAANGYNGYSVAKDSVGKDRMFADTEHYLGVSRISFAADINKIKAMTAMLESVIESDTPFEYRDWTDLKQHPATPPDRTAKTDEVSQAARATQLMYEIETELEHRTIANNISFSLQDRAAKAGETLNLPELENLLITIRGYSLKKAVIPASTLQLHKDIDMLHGILIDNKINNYEQPKHLAASVKLHLRTKTVHACDKDELLKDYKAELLKQIPVELLPAELKVA